jgi:serine/threonine protein phosphatase PrpC
MGLRRGAATDRGRMREGNEDSYLAAGPLAAVADGMGGHRAGEVASATAMDQLRALRHSGPWEDDRAAGEALKRAVAEANRRIRDLAASDKALEGMGTTLTALLEDGDSVHLAHVGDSRAYLLRHGELSSLTEDHTLVQELVRQGRLRPEDAERHPQRSIITRALGVDRDVEIDTATYKIVPGDRVLLCTDGLSGVVDQTRIRNVLLRTADPQQAADKLVAMANEAGGPDNITVIVLDADGVTTGVAERTGDLAAEDGDRTGTGTDLDPDDAMVTGLRRVGPGAGGRARVRPGRAAAGPRRRRRQTRRVLAVVLLLAALAGIALAGRALVLSRYWVGFHGDRVAVFRGVPGEVAGVGFSRLVADTGVTRAQVPPAYASSLENGVAAKDRADAFRIARCAPAVYTGCPADGTAPPTSAPPAAGATTTAPPTTRAG